MGQPAGTQVMAARHAQQLPGNTPGRIEALQSVAQEWAAKDTRAAMQWAETLTDEAERAVLERRHRSRAHDLVGLQEYYGGMAVGKGPAEAFKASLDIDPANPHNVTRAALLRTARLIMRGQVMVPHSIWHKGLTT